MSRTTSVGAIVLENAGTGPSPYSLAGRADDEDVDAVVVLLQRDYHCRNCRRQVQAVADRYDEFEAEGAVVVSVLPEPLERAADWQERYDLPFPLLADPGKEAGDEFDQPTRFGMLGQLHDALGRLPAALVFDATGDRLEEAYVHRGETRTDRPSVDELLAQVRQVGE